MTYELPALDYSYDALEPHIDAQTMEIHHTKHHAAYIAKLNAALEAAEVDAPECAGDLISKLNEVPEKIRTAVRNNGGGHVNHTIFWKIMSPDGGGKPVGELATAIDADFGNFDSFQEEFEAAATTRFGSGWAWLCVVDGGLKVCSTANQDNPIMGKEIAGCGGSPILGLDVWEHAYYLNYQNRRPDYIKAFWNLVNWELIAERFAKVNG